MKSLISKNPTIYAITLMVVLSLTLFSPEIKAQSEGNKTLWIYGYTTIRKGQDLSKLVSPVYQITVKDDYQMYDTYAALAEHKLKEKLELHAEAELGLKVAWDIVPGSRTWSQWYETKEKAETARLEDIRNLRNLKFEILSPGYSFGFSYHWKDYE